MQQPVRLIEVTDAAPRASCLTAGSVSRRWLLRALPGAAIGIMALLGLTGCGGENGEDEEDDD
jgi:hypothetical protein